MKKIFSVRQRSGFVVAWISQRQWKTFSPTLPNLFPWIDTNLGVLENVVTVDGNGVKSRSIKWAVSPKVRKVLDRILQRPDESNRTFIVEKVGDNFLAEILDTPNATSLGMLAQLEGKLLGGIMLINTSGRKYSSDHVRLLDSLNEPFAMAISNYLRYRETVRHKDLLADDNRYLWEELRGPDVEEIIGANSGLKQVIQLARAVAPLSSPVLLLGETGTGKEVMANAIHNLSPRKSGPFIKVNCGAIPESLIDSELFGHEKGSFTGALSRKRGRFERANGGTIFLDEIGELPPAAQIRLLRVFQEKEIERVGGTETIKLDIRIIAATHQNLEAMLPGGRFREDLYFRLRVFPIQIPPLRDRRADIPALAQHFVQKKSLEIGLGYTPSLAPDAAERLMSYDWPGNVRELQNEVERSLILSKGEPLAFENLDVPSGTSRTSKPTASLDTDSLGLETIIARHIVQVLNSTKGCVGGKNGAAHLLQINPSTLRKKMKKLRIPYGRKAQRK
jgi:transcriptional regulator with GAF, ATPase, and Fis domain